MLTFGNDNAFVNASQADTVGVENGHLHLTDPVFFFGLDQESFAVDGQLHDAESLRHDRLQAEFGIEFDTSMSFDSFGEESFAFRAGADGNATLPSIYSDGY